MNNVSILNLPRRSYGRKARSQEESQVRPDLEHRNNTVTLEAERGQADDTADFLAQVSDLEYKVRTLPSQVEVLENKT